MAKTLTYETCWEAHIYKVDGARIKKLIDIEILGELYSVDAHKETTGYSDMGHRCESTSTQFSVEVRIFGKPMRMDLSKLMKAGVKIVPVQYELEKE